MNETTKRVFKWFWAWNDDKEEAWLREMAQQGWHLKKVGAFGAYTFEQGEPRNVTYRLDFQSDGKEEETYLQLFTDAGWEHVGAMGGWQYFRIETPEDEHPEIYTDNTSKIQKYQRVLLFLVIFLPILIATAGSDADDPLFVQIVGWAMVPILLIYIYATIRLIARINELKKM
ncbi:MAG: DUF2812 domain-containing protein [Anaerolineae bacterium]|nr:DUF2812 domain-containing protein [Anaerolineae bacterium]